MHDLARPNSGHEKLNEINHLEGLPKKESPSRSPKNPNKIKDLQSQLTMPVLLCENPHNL